jgi:RimJ/RimL family protein N-acetyltransferase
MIDQLTRGPTLRTARLDLRPIEAADAPRIAALANDYDIVRMTGAMPYPYGLADAEGYIARTLAAGAAARPTFVLDLPGEGLIGVLGFVPTGPLGPEVGYWLGRPYWGRGYASEALLGAMAWARDDLRARCVTAGYFADNPASGTVLVKAGFLYTGEVVLSPSLARGEAAPSRRMVWLA